MSEIISKELLSEVLQLSEVKIGRHLTTGKFSYGNRQEFYYFDGHDTIHEIINIHELAHKCKEWAFQKGWLLQIRTGLDLSVIDVFNADKQELQIRRQISEQTEPEAIFKACEWILKKL